MRAMMLKCVRRKVEARAAQLNLACKMSLASAGSRKGGVQGNAVCEQMSKQIGFAFRSVVHEGRIAGGAGTQVDILATSC